MFLLLIGALSGLLLATGCGSDDAEEITVETGSLSKAQFVKKADAICERSIRKVLLASAAYIRNVESSEAPFAAQKEEAPKFIETVLVPQYEGQIDKVSSIGAPRGDEGEVEAVLKALREVLDKAEAEPVKFLQSLNTFAVPRRLGREYGFSSCGRLS